MAEVLKASVISDTLTFGNIEALTNFIDKQLPRRHENSLRCSELSSQGRLRVHF